MQRTVRAVFAVMCAAASVHAQTFSRRNVTRRTVERRAVEAAIWGMPLVNVDAMRQAYFRAGASYNDVIFWSNPNTWMNQTTTPNHSTSYVMFFMNLKDGPVVVDIPAAKEQALYGTLINAWNEPLLNVGNTGHDKGKGAKYLMLPPGYKETPPQGYVPVPCSTYNCLQPAADHHQDAQRGGCEEDRLSAYPQALSAGEGSVARPDPVHRRGASRSRRSRSTTRASSPRWRGWCGRERAGPRPGDHGAALLVKHRQGAHFDPDAAMKQTLDRAVEEAHQWMMEGYATNGTFVWPKAGRTWRFLLDVPLAEGTKVTSWSPGRVSISTSAPPPGSRCLARSSPPPQLYVKTYETEHPSGLTAATHIICACRPKSRRASSGRWTFTTPRPARSSASRPSSASIPTSRSLKKNADGTVDVYFAPEPPAGQDSNWILTREGKPFFVMFRIYGPQKGAVDGSWILNDMERVSELTGESCMH